MKRRRWKPEQKALIVLEGLKGRPIGELCAEHEISQGQYYQWRDQFLANAGKALEPAGAPQRQGRLERENARLKILVGELALELKKSEEILGGGAAPTPRARHATARCSNASERSRRSIRSGVIGRSGRICATSTAWRSTKSASTAR